MTATRASRRQVVDSASREYVSNFRGSLRTVTGAPAAVAGSSTEVDIMEILNC
ncbi:hypothetical protein [Saccharopolyspora spinosa]|uniref:hypothetical protein n=1 Tax=Saccharopolyspora spinosa TaxID=60894 RepID=UPI003BAD05DB